MRETLTALDLPLDNNKDPQLQKNYTSVLISRLLQAVHCTEQTGTSQDACEKVRPTTSAFIEAQLQNNFNFRLNSTHMRSTFLFHPIPACLLLETC